MAGPIALGREPSNRASPRTRILVLANKGPGRAPGQRFRFEQWAPWLARDHGIGLDLLPFESPQLTDTLYDAGRFLNKAAWVSFDFVRRAQSLLLARKYDAVLIFREAALIGPAFYERIIGWSGVPIIFDYDDSIWSQSQERRNGIFSSLHFFGKTETLCRIATAVTPGNEFLADYARRFNHQVSVIPTSIELDDYPLQPELPSGHPFVVCWTGSTSTLAHFEHARNALEIVARRMPLMVKIICNTPPDRAIAGAEMQFVPWSAEGEAAEIGASHVGIMPLPDNEATRGKCGLKALQYMATGRPAIASPVGMNTELIVHGENGFLADTSDQYVERLIQLAESPSLRGKLGAQARRTVEQGYSARAVAARFASVVDQVVNPNPR